MTGKGRGLVGRKLKKVGDRQSRGSLHKIGVIGGGGGGGTLCHLWYSQGPSRPCR